jgi:hypothetical protein
MDNKEVVFKCAICGTLYANVLDRAKCEIACAEKQEEEAKKAAEAKKHAEYNDRKAAVDAAFDLAYDLKAKFLMDYGSYIYSKTIRNSEDMLDAFGWLM